GADWVEVEVWCFGLGFGFGFAGVVAGFGVVAAAEWVEVVCELLPQPTTATVAAIVVSSARLIGRAPARGRSSAQASRGSRPARCNSYETRPGKVSPLPPRFFTGPNGSRSDLRCNSAHNH